ncbi:MAG TPA: amidophosphoribosyltransferase [Syntrophorhabdaceae bacterium]|nr:amidophosphoribosyltransferase [Syntrophorhabdaceae bacterium]HQM82299.1 amidophosphoribosyltransferase [Syntrophorhabdaceae bacterium]
MCGIFGIFNHKDAANLTYLGLHALQHRGQESAGISSTDGVTITTHREMGLVSDIFDADVLQKLKGHAAIGHVRYSTAGSSNIGNAQPLSVEYSQGHLAIAHNGNLINAKIIKDELQNYGSIFQSTTDTEVIIHLIALSHEHSTLERFTSALSRVEGSYSLVLLNNKELIVARDPKGFRPLVLGKIKDSHVVSSESCAFDLIGARYMREVEPGEVIHIGHQGMKSYRPFKKVNPQYCIFEYIYFARPDSFMFGETVYSVRKDLGRQLAKDTHVDADMVMAIPDSGISAAIGYSQETGLPFELGLIRNHYVGRTFIEPEESIRHFGVKLKLNAIHDIVKGKRIIVIDDSIVRATTGRKIIKMLRQYGAKEIHFRVSAPPTTHPCFYGIDTPSRGELIASSHTVWEINKYLGSDSLRYLTRESLRKAVGKDNYTFCDACFSGVYPSKFPWDMELEQMELFSKR